jgi:hypothetical protein
MDQNIINEAKRIEEDSIYSAKGHFYASHCWSTAQLWLGGISTILSAIAGASLLAKYDNYSLIGGILSLIVVTLTAVLTFINPNQRANEHLVAGNKFNALKNDARIFYSIKVNECDNVVATKLLEKLNERRNKLNQESPQIPKWAFEKARKGIENGESKYLIDKENE